MARKSAKLKKLRKYRDKLIADNVNLKGIIRLSEESFRQARVALSNADYIRTYAVLTRSDDSKELSLKFVDKNELAKELTLIYKMLAVERTYTDNMHRAAQNRDLLRILALTADHEAEVSAHDKLLSAWSQEHGFTGRLRDEMDKS